MSSGKNITMNIIGTCATAGVLNGAATPNKLAFFGSTLSKPASFSLDATAEPYGKSLSLAAATAIGKSAAVCGNLLKISMEGIAEEAYLASKGNV
jgi:hypothetical protein